MPNYHLFKLHLMTLLSSLIPIVVLLIDLPAIEIVLLRCFFTAIIVFSFIYYGNLWVKLPTEHIFKLLVNGVLMAFYWVLLFLSAKLSNASVSLIGIASASVWISILTPILNREAFCKYQIMTGVTAFIGIIFIANSGFEHYAGLFVAVAAGFFGAMLTIKNAELAGRHHYYLITFYQMIGACLSIIIFLPAYLFLFDGNISFRLTMSDLLWILFLSIFFGSLVYAQLIKLMRSVTPFMVTLTANLSPIYGMTCAFIFFGEKEMMNIEFYMGTLIIILSVIGYPLLEKRIIPKKEKEKVLFHE